MPYTKGIAFSYPDLVAKIVEWATDEEIHGEDAWELMRSDPWPRGTILKAPGWEAGEHFYVGLMPQTIVVGSSYRSWFCTPERVATHFAYGSWGRNITPSPYVKIGPSFVTVEDPPSDDDKDSKRDATTYSLSEIDIFAENAQALFLGAFKQYSGGLDWDEQASGIRPYLRIKPAYCSITNRKYPEHYYLPLSPGAGWPAFGMDYDGPVGGYLEYWLVKDRRRLIVATKNGAYWDAGYAGFIEPYHTPTEYACPLAVVGGTSGVRTLGWLEYRGSATNPDVYTGFQLDYRPSNWNLSHGIAPFAATPCSNGDEGTISQVQLLLPSGYWQSFAVYGIKEAVYSDPAMGHDDYGPFVYGVYHFAHDEPQRIKLPYYLRPAVSDLYQTRNVLDQNAGLYSHYQAEPIEFVQDTPGEVNLLGRLARMYWPSTPVRFYGEQVLNGKKYLVLPNGWEGRPWHIYNGRTDVDDSGRLLAQYTRAQQLSRTMNLIIQLED